MEETKAHEPLGHIRWKPAQLSIIDELRTDKTDGLENRSSISEEFPLTTHLPRHASVEEILEHRDQLKNLEQSLVGKKLSDLQKSCKNRSTLGSYFKGSDFQRHTIYRIAAFDFWETVRKITTGFVGILEKWNGHHRRKKVKATQEVLQTYHNSFLYGEIPLAGRLRAALRVGKIGYLLVVAEFNLAILSGVLYVYSTYTHGPTENWIRHIQDIISFVFMADYISRFYSEPARLCYLFSLNGVIDLLSAVPVVFLFRLQGKGIDCIHLVQFLRMARIFSCLERIGISGSTVIQQIIRLTFATIGVIVLDAGILHWLEHNSPEVRSETIMNGPLTFAQSLYFLIVTVSTVGYGDIVPSTMAGKALAIMTIIGTILILPAQISRINSLAYHRPYGSSFNAWEIIDSRMLIIAGSVNLQVIRDFLAEFYNPAHCEDFEAYPLYVVIMAPFRPSFELQRVLSYYGEQVKFVEGSPISETDLDRVGANNAAAFFLLADKESKDKKIEDAAQIVRALAVRRFCSKRVRVIVEVLEPATQNSVVWGDSSKGGIEVICPAKIHYKMLSRSCYVRGLYTFIANLFTAELRLNRIPSNHFLEEYFESYDTELYPVILPNVFHGLLFEEVVEFIFQAFDALLFALDIPIRRESSSNIKRVVLLHPRGHYIEPDDLGFVLAEDLHTAFSISKLTAYNLETSVSRRAYLFLKSCLKFRKRANNVEILKDISSRWTVKRSRPSFYKSLSLQEALSNMEQSPRAEPSSPNGYRKLKRHLRSTIHRVLSEGSSESGIWDDYEDHNMDDTWNTFRGLDIDDDISPQFVGLSLEAAAEELLGWPPPPQYGRPHPAVLERKTEAILHNLKDRTISIVNLKSPHLLVCCQGSWPNNLYYFLVGLRRPRFPRPPVVILHPKSPTAFQWGSVGIFKDVYFLQGSPIYEVDLMRGGIFQAEKVIILSDQGTPVEVTAERIEESGYRRRLMIPFTTDINNFLIAANIEQMIQNKVNVLTVEMEHMIGFYYLHPQFKVSRDQIPKVGYSRNPNALVRYTPPYMEGKAVCTSMLSFLLHSTFYNKNTIPIVEQFVDGGPVETHEGLSFEQLRVLDQISVPKEYAEQPYSKLFLDLLYNCGMLALGLYRAAGTLGSPCYYVLTNPKKETLVHAQDLIFVLK